MESRPRKRVRPNEFAKEVTAHLASSLCPRFLCVTGISGYDNHQGTRRTGLFVAAKLS